MPPTAAVGCPVLLGKMLPFSEDERQTPSASGGADGNATVKGRLRLLLSGLPCGSPARLFSVVVTEKSRPDRLPLDWPRGFFDCPPAEKRVCRHGGGVHVVAPSPAGGRCWPLLLRPLLVSHAVRRLFRQLRLGARMVAARQRMGAASRFNHLRNDTGRWPCRLSRILQREVIDARTVDAYQARLGNPAGVGPAGAVAELAPDRPRMVRR